MRRKIPGLFVTGTDTGVGKTLVACALAAWYRKQGLRVGVMKPVATGGLRRNGCWVGEDAIWLAQAAGTHLALKWINPVCFKEPIAPWAAAQRVRRRILLRPLLQAFKRVQTPCDFLVVEGIGGLLVPLSATATVADLAKRLRLPLIIVARTGLGTLNHTLLTIQVARQYGLPISAIILNESKPLSKDSLSRAIAKTNRETLMRLSDAPVLGPLPYLPRFVQKGSTDLLAAFSQKHLPVSLLRHWAMLHGVTAQ